MGEVGLLESVGSRETAAKVRSFAGVRLLMGRAAVPMGRIR